MPVLSALGAAAFFTLAHVVDPNDRGTYPTCPWLRPHRHLLPRAAARLRATNALTHGDVGTALARNPLAVISYAVILVGFLNYTVRMWTGRPKHAPGSGVGALRPVLGDPRASGCCATCRVTWLSPA